MNLVFAFLAPLALLVPALASQPSAPVSAGEGTEKAEPARVPTAAQVRIDRRVTIRISPLGPAPRQNLVADMAPSSAGRLEERKMGKCVAVAGIAAVKPDAGSNLLLFMRDHRLVSARLEKACSARDFYSGFYLEPSRDGMLCADRDKLHSRAGANCEISRMRQLVAVED